MRAFKWSPAGSPKIKRNGAGKLGCCCATTCDEGNSEVQSIQVTTASVTGEWMSGEFCDHQMIAVSATCDSGVLCSPCVTHCLSAEADVEFTCPDDCETEEAVTIQFDAEVEKDSVTGDWTLIINIDVVGTSICGGSDFGSLFGGDSTLELNVGADPTGTHNLVFDDLAYPDIHYTATVVIVK